MTLIKAYVINFGKFHEKEFDFQSGLNSYNEENGWGKTTLAAFIKAMFYGFEENRSRDITKNEKARYTPWQSGTFGGYLTFEHNGKVYQVTRTFGKKSTEDTFNLRDMKTNKLSADFSEKLGEELFGVSRDTYERSAHVSLDVTPAGSTTDISARLNNLVEAGDMGNFDAACQLLNDRCSALVKRGNKGEIADLQTKIDDDRAKLSDIASKEKANEQISYTIGQLHEEMTQMKSKQEEVSAKLASSTRYEHKLRYLDLQKAAADAESEYAGTLQFFNGSVPSREEMERISALVRQYTTVDSNIQTQSASQAEKDDYQRLKDWFAGDVPTQQQISQCLDADRQYTVIQQQKAAKSLSQAESADLIGLRQKFAGKTLSQEIINEKLQLFDRIQTDGASLAAAMQDRAQKDAELNAARQIKPKNTRRIIFLLAGAVAFIAGAAALALLKNVVVGGVCGLFGAVLSVLALVAKAPQADVSEQENAVAATASRIESLQQSLNEKQAEVQSFVDSLAPGNKATPAVFNTISIEYARYAGLLEKESVYTGWLQDSGNAEAACLSVIKSFMTRFCKTDDISTVTSSVQALTERLNRLNNLEKRINADSDNAGKRQELDAQLSAAFSRYAVTKSAGYEVQLQECVSKRSACSMAKQAVASAKDALAGFERDNDNLEDLLTAEKPEKTQNEYQADYNQIGNELTIKNKELRDRESQLEMNLAVTDRRNDIETEIERLSEEKHEKEEEYRLLQETIQLLSQAKENLDANYGDPMAQRFTDYVKRLGSTLPLIIDTDLQVSVDDKGKLHGSESLSAGYKDLVNFCSRMALIDALYTESVPPVLLDDPFVNLDDEKIPPALELIKKMAAEKQILYFTCHESRAV